MLVCSVSSRYNILNFPHKCFEKLYGIAQYTDIGKCSYPVQAIRGYCMAVIPWRLRFLVLLAEGLHLFRLRAWLKDCEAFYIYRNKQMRPHDKGHEEERN